MSDQTIIFSMAGVSKIYPPQKQVLKNIYLSFFYGAKIGVLGLNGSGKSSLLKIIAGVDKQFQGEVVFSPGYSVGYLEQEPQLDPVKTVREVVEEGVAETVALLKEYDEINEAFGAEDADFDKLLERQGTVQERLDQLDAWNLDSKLERAMDALRTPGPEHHRQPVGRREAPRGPVPPAAAGARRAAARRAHQPPRRRSVLWLEQHLQQYKGTVIAVTHDRYFLDNVAGWILELDRGQGIPWKGNYSSWLEQKTQRLAQEENTESKRAKTLQRELDWVRMSPKARQSKGKARLANYDKLASEEAKDKEQKLELFIPDGPRLGAQVIEAEGPAQGFRRQAAVRKPELLAAAGRHRGHHRAQRRGQNHALPHDNRPDEARRRLVQVGPHGANGLRRPAARHAGPNKSVFDTITGGTETMLLAGRPVNSRAYVSKFNFGGGDQKRKWLCSRAARRTACT
jgi:ATPase subunit of ABC transporter with duplicated ATPase domains